MEDNFNKHLGNKLKLRRLALGLTQTKVAKAINVTFQQIQKYEKGTNGVSSNRLMQLSQFLKVPIIYFFEDFKEFKDLVTDETLPDSKKLNTDIWYEEDTYLWVKAAFEKTGYWEYRIKKVN